MAKKKNTPLPSFMNAGNSWYNDLKKWEKDREVRVEQSKAWDAAGDKAPYAGRITPTYNDEKFNEKEGTLANKSSKWRTAAVEDLPSKRYGKKYNDRLHALMDEAGIPKSERYEFAKWMDAQEQKIESNVVQGYTARPVTEKEAFMANKGPQLNMALPDVGKRNISQAVERVKNENRNVAEKAVAAVKNIDGGSVLDGLLKGGKEVSRFLNNVSNLGMPMFESMDKSLAERTFERTGDRTLLDRYEDMYGTEGRGTAGKVSDFIGEGIGMLATGAGIAGGIRGLTTKLGVAAPQTLKGAAARLAGEGAAVGAIDQTARSIQNQTIAKDLERNQGRTWRDEARDIGIATGAGAVLDPLVSLAGPAMRQLSRRSVDSALTGTARQQADVLEELTRHMPRVPEMDIPGRNISNSVTSPLNNRGNASRNILEQLQAGNINENIPTGTQGNSANSMLDPQESSQMNIWERFDRPVSTANNSSTVPNSQTNAPEPTPTEEYKPISKMLGTSRPMDQIRTLEQDPEFLEMALERNSLIDQLEVDDNPIRSGRAKRRIMELNGLMGARARNIFGDDIPATAPENTAPAVPDVDAELSRLEAQNADLMKQYKAAEKNRDMLEMLRLEPIMDRTELDLAAYKKQMKNQPAATHDPTPATEAEMPSMNPALDPARDKYSLGPEELAMRQFILESDPEYQRLQGEVNRLWDLHEQAELADDIELTDKLAAQLQEAEKALDVRHDEALRLEGDRWETVEEPPAPTDLEPYVSSSPQPPNNGPEDVMERLRAAPLTPQAAQTATTAPPVPPASNREPSVLDGLLEDVRRAGAQAEGTPQGAPRRQPVDLENYDSPIHYRDTDAPAAKKKEDSFATEAYRSMVSATGEFRKIDDYFANKQRQMIAEGLPDGVDVDKLLRTTPDGSLAVDSSVRKGARSLTRVQAKAVSFMENNYKNVAQKIKKYNINQQELDEYALARHAMDIFQKNGGTVQQRHILEQQFDEMINGGSVDLDELNRLQDEIADLNPYRLHESVTPEWADSIIRQFEGNPQLNEVYNDFMAAQKKTLEYARDSGTLSNEAFEMLQKEHPHYVSLARHVEPSASRGNGPGSGNTGIGTRGGGSESLKHLPPFETAMRNAYIIASNAERNKALQPIAKMAGMDDLGEFFVKRPRATDKTVTVHVNGKPQHYEVPDHLLWYVKEGSQSPSPGKIGKVARVPANMMRKLTTHYNPSFHLVSAVRDTQQAVFQSRTGNPLRMAIDVPLGFVDSFAGDLLEKATGGRIKSFKKFYEEQGGGYTQFITTDQESMAKAAKAIQDGTFGKSTTGSKVKSIVMAPANMLESFGNAIERGPKLAELRSASRKGYSPDDAMYEAVDVMDYSDVGTAVRKINPYVPYFGATMRGNARIMKAFTEGGAAGAAKQLGKGALMFTMPTAAIYAMREMDYVTEDQRHELRNMQDWQKNLYWHVPMPDGESILSIHKPHVLGQLFANPLERALDQINEETMKTDGQAARGAAWDLVKSFVPPSEMAGLSTAWDLYRNQDGFTLFDIESQYDRDAAVPNREIEAYEQSNVTRGIANVLNAGQENGWVSPAQVDFAVKDLTGTMGKQALTVLDDLIRTQDPSGDYSNAGIRDSMDELLKPITQFKADPTRSSGVTNALKPVAAREKQGNMDKKGMSEAEKAAEDARRPAQNYQKEIKELNKQIQAIRDNKKLTSDEKRSRIEELRKEQDKIGSKVINWWNRTN